MRPEPAIASACNEQQRVAELLGRMSLEDKIGQMALGQPGEGRPEHSLADAVRSGRLGAIINVVDRDAINELQRIAVEESPHGIPLLVGRDVIHGFQTIMPIPLGQAASWNPDIVRQAARHAAIEAAQIGVNWTYAPMMDIARDPRWGRIAESLGEDVYLTCQLAAAMVEGFQGESLARSDSIAACAKHFVGYGAVESGRDYATTNIPDNELHNVYLPPFKAAIDSGVASLMTSFSDLDGIPATAHGGLLGDLLREEWRFPGVVVSDWESITELTEHGITADDRDAAITAATAGVDLEMAGNTYANHLAEAVRSGEVSLTQIDAAVSRILAVKLQLGLFERPYSEPSPHAQAQLEGALKVAREAALQSLVLLQNHHQVLPLDPSQLSTLAVIGPLADASYEQLGTWIFDGDRNLSVSALAGIRAALGDAVNVAFAPGLDNSRSRNSDGIDPAVEAARQADAVILVLGEESILSGEAHSRAEINLPGAQLELVRRIRHCGKPVVAVIMAGRPLTLAPIIDQVDAIVYAWHPGCMGGAALADVLFGIESPSGKLPVTFPRAVGQIPLYYNAKNSGRPPSPGKFNYIDDIPVEAPQTSLGMTAFHLDVCYTPQFVFGHGLSYTEFVYSNLQLSSARIQAGESLTVSVDLHNAGQRAGEEIVQLYVRDPVASITRPIRELKGFKRVRLEPGQTVRVELPLHTDALKFYRRGRGWAVEPGRFLVWVGGDSNADLGAEFEVLGAGPEHPHR